MSDKLLLLSLSFFALAIYCQRIWIRWMRHFRLGQAIKEYGPEEHLKKQGTPSMGGVVALFLLPLLVASVAAAGLADVRQMLQIWCYPALAAAIGLLDDLLKLKNKSSEGLRSLQKLCLQILVTVPFAYFAGKDAVYLLPGLPLSSAAGIPLLVFLGVGIQNAVNVTDGLDGLAGGAVAVSLAAFAVIATQDGTFVSSILGLALVAAFLWHNCHPAEVFMGDAGAHLWAGLLIALCVSERALLLVFPFAWLFGVEIVSVAIQIVAIRRFGRKVFKMSPLHHHFELSGWRETKIVTRFWLIHFAGMTALLTLILTVFGEGVW